MKYKNNDKYLKLMCSEISLISIIKNLNKIKKTEVSNFGKFYLEIITLLVNFQKF